MTQSKIKKRINDLIAIRKVVEDFDSIRVIGIKGTREYDITEFTHEVDINEVVANLEDEIQALKDLLEEEDNT